MRAPPASPQAEVLYDHRNVVKFRVAFSCPEWGAKGGSSMARKRKTLPKDFQETLISAPLEELIAGFDVCEIDARGGYTKSTAIGFPDCPDELILWLVEQGLDVDSRDSRGLTALAKRAECAMQKYVDQIPLLLSLGADIEAPDTRGHSPYRNAVVLLKVSAANLLAERDAATSGDGWNSGTLLESALQRVENSSITEAVGIARLLVAQGAPITEKMRNSIERIGQNFERYRDVFAADRLDATQSALDELYATFDVAPAGRRVMHDGTSAIVVEPGSWEQQHKALWKLLVSGSGPAGTEQGEVIRITGKVDDEMFRNGGANWNADFRTMVDKVVSLLGTRDELSPDALVEARAVAREVRTGRGAKPELDRFSELAVEWVAQNPEPHALGDVSYAY